MSEIHNNIEKCRVEFLDQLEQASSADEIQDLKVKYLGKKGKVTSLLKTLGSLPPEKRPAVGQLVNKLRDEIEEQLSIRKTFLEEKEWEEADRKSSLMDSLLGGVGCFQWHRLFNVIISFQISFSVVGPETRHFQN